MSSSYNTHHSEGAKAEQIITEFFAKSLHIILESRTPCMSSRHFSGEQMVSSPSSTSSSSPSVKPRDKWFNLALRECPAALENFDIWRQRNLEPLVVDVALVQSPLVLDPMNTSGKRELQRNLSGKECHSGWNSDQDELGFEGKSEMMIIERWIVHYDTRKIRETGACSRRSSSNKLQLMYKKSILLLRSLFATVRLLPAYKIFRDLNSSGQIHKFKLVPRVPSIVEPFPRREEAEMQKFAFMPVDTSRGRLCLSVLYRSLSDVGYEPPAPVSPTFISDYVGSPLADPLKRFPSLPLSHGSPSSSSFSRRHSWSSDQYKPSPPSVSFSPSPTHSDSHASVSNLSSRRLLPAGSLPPHPSEIPGFHRKDSFRDEYPPPFLDFPSPSSPSAPIHIPRSHLHGGITRAESAPVRITAAKLMSSPSKLSVPPSPPPPKLSRHGSFKPGRNPGPVDSGATIEKLFLSGRDDPRKHSGARLSSNISPQISFSRSSSRSFPDDFDDPDFPCPFDVEDDDVTDPVSRPGSFDRRGDIPEPHESGGLFPMKKSQDAAVGALVRMLKKAPPLRQDLSASTNTNSLSEPTIPENSCNNKNSRTGRDSASTRVPETASVSVMASALLAASRTTADALEELRCYKEMKNMLLSQSGRTFTSPDPTMASSAS